ncbi:MAG: phosphoribosylamine--glycine ligase, partial [Candidatus Dormibacteraeota bacterium]|nr:phosphoribosylamine--glycine ligase [Candidatus Dormibacteraeota bacterium]
VDSVQATVLQPCVDALREMGCPFVGCLYAGLMLTADGPRVLEFNARFGDPEAQVVLPLMGEPLPALLTAAAHAALKAGTVTRRNGACAGVVAAAAGYPGSVHTGAEITGLETLDDSVLCFHAGTRIAADGRLRTAGGRVLCLVAHRESLHDATQDVYANLGRVRFDGMWYRHDIGATGLAALRS